MGTLAEAWTDETLRKTPGVYAAVPSFKFAGKDVDHVVVARAGIIAVETKWRATPPDGEDQQRAAQQAASAGRTLRLSMRRKELPERLFQNLVGYWGPGLGDLAPRVIETAVGPVTIMGGKLVPSWLSDRRTGPVDTDYAESLHEELRQVALERDRTIVKAGPLLRWLARI